MFGYSVDISVNETMIAGIATGTAIFLVPLPHPIALQFPKTYHETVPADRQNTRDQMEKLSQKNVLTSTILFNYTKGCRNYCFGDRSRGYISSNARNGRPSLKIL